MADHATGGDLREYPSHWEADVVLSDGGTMHVRPIRPDDHERLVRFHQRQSPESIYFRFFSPRPRLSPRDVERFTTVDYVDRMAFVGLLGDEMVGVARYDRNPSRSQAEVAFFTDDAQVGRGIGTVLLEFLAGAAREAGIDRFCAQVLPTNRRMLSVFRQAGFEVSSHFEDGVMEVELQIEPTDEARAAIAERAAASEAASVARILAPRTVAVVGASRRPGTVGNVVFRRLLEQGFEGPVYPVNPEGGVVASVRAYPSLGDVPDAVDLAVVVVPADRVEQVVEECGRLHVRGLVVMSAGFAELGGAGAELERRVVGRARALGMRMVGPNTMGVINNDPAVRLHASFTEVAPRPGRIAVASQSGTIGAAVLDALAAQGLGVSSFVATGNKADVSGNDLLQYWEHDPGTDQIVLYLESFGNPRNFGRIARRVAATKPIVAVKAGRVIDTAPGRPAAEAIARPIDAAGWPADVTIDALLRQTGVIRVDTLGELVDVTRVLAAAPLPRSNRVAVVSNFWGPAVLAADSCAAAGLELAELSPATIAALGAAIGARGRAANPVELTGRAGPVEYAGALRAVLADPAVGSVLAVYGTPLRSQARDVAAAVAAAANDADVPVVASFLGPHDPQVADALVPVPGFSFPEEAARALGRLTEHAAWRALPAGTLPALDGTDEEAARALVATLLPPDPVAPVPLAPDEARELLGTFGVVPVAQRLVVDGDDAVRAAEELGYPVALKASGLDRPSKTEAGGLAVDVYGGTELRAAYERMVALHGAAMHPAVVQAMAPGGVDVALGVHQHPALGSVLTLGPAGQVGGVLRIVPLTGAEASRLVGDAVPGLGEPAAEALADLVLRVSALADAVPEVALLHLDPILVTDGGATPTDVHLQLAPWHHEPDPVIRRLR